MSEELFQAAKDADWVQVILNQGPPCFHLEHGRFCLRAKRWHDWGDAHVYVSLEDLLRTQSATRAPSPALDRLKELVESAIMDFLKLKPLIGDAADAVADLYEQQLKSICSPT